MFYDIKHHIETVEEEHDICLESHGCKGDDSFVRDRHG